MIPVRETAPGVFERLSVAENPVLTRLDGEAKAPLRTVLASSWTAEERAAYGVHLVEPATAPAGKLATGAPRYERQGDTVVEVRALADAPPPPPERTPAEKVARMLRRHGLTLDELQAVLADAGVKAPVEAVEPEAGA